MQALPNLSGLPPWAAILATVIFCMTTLLVARLGYTKPTQRSGEQQVAQILGAQIADMGAVRHLADVCIKLMGTVERLDQCIENHTHYLRDHNELLKENCQRLRELREILERQSPRH